MKTGLKRWLTPPHFPDEEKTRTARILHAVLLIALGAGVFFIITFSVVNPEPGVAMAVTAVIILISLVAFVILQKGHIRAAAYFFTLVMWLAITPAHFFFGGVVFAGAYSQIIVIAIAGLLVGRRASVTFAGLATLAILTLAYVDEGTGIGLALCRRIVEKHYGRIQSTGQQDQGATFVVTLPTKQSNLQEITSI